ncbi:L-fucose isomerase [Staphylococcus nepalensis]|uniref:L-fucose isomerase n=1 Tax=Staphylococcus nepalensis TaxID=214473 RepID=A0ABS3L2K3_9STAP|nr:L-fucose isomerase [Staphylococcus nepalensis]MBO1206298.1 L-fucose isomerase [Staphylococcus nepalensis]MBO1212307.1 L-fucose isomerase [Staphylococcus nepalensis]MBO1217056.1 L-fucose isomerase [Staphylococcus nepalensis]MBO1227784.1 L-fucose isomerase [Staphylococcus nepalensis]MBO1235318.1 L-fucose isomerase [Staphylococcus nepalensis]
MFNNLPKIGIRPTIDGRRKGVRESLEKQTMQMAKSVEKFIKENLKYPNGKPVECVISDTTIGGVAEASKCKEKFDKENICGTITVTPCWCYGSETMDMRKDIPHAIWGLNGTERPGAVYLAAVLAAHAQKGIPAFGIYGEQVQDAEDEFIPDDVKSKIISFTKSALAKGLMRDKSYLSIGNVAMGIAGSMINEDFFQKYLGMRNEQVESVEIIRRMNEGIYDKEEFERALKWTKENFAIAENTNSEENQVSKKDKNEQLEFIVKMTIIGRDLLIGNEKLAELGFEEEAGGHNAIVGGFQGQRQWTDYYPNGDFLETILNTSFDWNGKRQPHIFATENDSLNGISMLFNYLLTNRAQIFSDVRTYWSPDSVKRVTGKHLEGKAKDGILHLINSGSTTLDGTGQQTKNNQPVMKPYWDITENEVEDCIKNTKLVPANREYFRGGGFSTNFLTKGGMPMTMCRLNLVDGLGPVLQIVEGYSVELSSDVHEILDQRTDPGWPTTWFAPRLTGKGAFKSVYDVMNNWGANHGAISYGHIGKELITLASMLRIPVNMHNVDDKDIFRPKVWSSFGTESLESADFRACENFGPVYK